MKNILHIAFFGQLYSKSSHGFILPIHHLQTHQNVNSLSSSSSSSSSLLFSTSTSSLIGNRIRIDESCNGLKQIYSNPDIFIIENFLDEESCQDLISKAQEKKLDLSPVAYAGKSDDKSDLISLAAKGPVAWLSIISAWFQLQNNSDNSGDLVQFGIHVLENYGLFFLLAFALINAFIESRVDELQTLRTSTSTTLDNLDDPESGTSE